MAAVFWFAVGLIVVTVVVLAALSDRRDRRAEVDPTMRVQALGARRRDARQRRAEALTKRISGQRRTKPAEDRPWER